MSTGPGRVGGDRRAAGGTRSPFDPLVDAYDRARPSYPEPLFDALAERVRPLTGARVVEVGAGTGIATRALLGRGARVLALDIGTEMLRRLLRRTPGAHAALADGHALPLPDAAVDLVCYAQAWHWMRTPEAATEAVRVLRVGGALCLWWNDVDAADQPWWRHQQDRLEEGNPDYRRGYRDTDDATALAALGILDVETLPELRWWRDISVEDYLTWLESKSYVAALGTGRERFLDAERASMTAAFPAGVVREPFRTRLIVGHRR